jgi:hypothetical protein
MCNGGCECGCAGTCDSVICGSTGGCCGACNACPPPPLPSCGCGGTLVDGETCLNQAYYLVATNSQTGQQGYFLFVFNYCILTTLTGTTFSSPSECVAQWISIYYQLDISNLWLYNYITNSPPSGVPMATQTGSGSGIDGYGYANNAFLWAIDVNYYQTNPFTACCDASAYPAGIYPSCST